MVHLIYKLYLKAIFVFVKFNGAIGFSEKCLFFTVKHVLNSKKWAWDPKNGSWQSQNWCLTIPKMVPDCPKNGFWDCFWDPKYDTWQLTVQKSTAHLYSSVQSVVRHHIWDLRKYPRYGAWQLSGTSFGTVRHQFWDRQATVLGSHAYF